MAVKRQKELMLLHCVAGRNDATSVKYLLKRELFPAFGLSNPAGWIVIGWLEPAAILGHETPMGRRESQRNRVISRVKHTSPDPDYL